MEIYFIATSYSSQKYFIITSYMKYGWLWWGIVDTGFAQKVGIDAHGNNYIFVNEYPFLPSVPNMSSE